MARYESLMEKEHETASAGSERLPEWRSQDRQTQLYEENVWTGVDNEIFSFLVYTAAALDRPIGRWYRNTIKATSASHTATPLNSTQMPLRLSSQPRRKAHNGQDEWNNYTEPYLNSQYSAAYCISKAGWSPVHIFGGTPPAVFNR